MSDADQLERLRQLVAEQSVNATSRHAQLQQLQASAQATTLILDALARKPADASESHRSLADVLLVMPSSSDAERFVDHMKEALGPNAHIRLDLPTDERRDGPSLPSGYALRSQITVTGLYGADLSAHVQSALRTLEGVVVDYSEPLDLIVVTPARSGIGAVVPEIDLAALRRELEPGHYMVYEDRGEIVVHGVKREWTRIGRSLAADIRFDDETVSRRHALVVNQPDGVRVLDDRSQTGVFVNGERIEWSPLTDGDVLQVGTHLLALVSVGEPGSPANPTSSKERWGLLSAD